MSDNATLDEQIDAAIQHIAEIGRERDKEATKTEGQSKSRDWRTPQRNEREWSERVDRWAWHQFEKMWQIRYVFNSDPEAFAVAMSKFDRDIEVEWGPFIAGIVKQVSTARRPFEVMPPASDFSWNSPERKEDYETGRHIYWSANLLWRTILAALDAETSPGRYPSSEPELASLRTLMAAVRTFEDEQIPILTDMMKKD